MAGGMNCGAKVSTTKALSTDKRLSVFLFMPSHPLEINNRQHSIVTRGPPVCAAGLVSPPHVMYCRYTYVSGNIKRPRPFWGHSLDTMIIFDYFAMRRT